MEKKKINPFVDIGFELDFRLLGGGIQTRHPEVQKPAQLSFFPVAWTTWEVVPEAGSNVFEI